MLNTHGGDLSQRWYIDHYHTGKRVREWIAARPAKTRQERAENKLKYFQEFCGLGSSNIMPVLFGIVEKDETLRGRTKDTYKSSVRLLAAYFAGRNLRTLTVDEAPGFVDWMRKTKKYSDTSVKNNLSHLKRVLKTAKQNIFADYSTTYNIEESEFNRPFTDFERTLLENEMKAENHRLFIFTRFIFYAYIRPAELMRLTVSDIDLRNRTIKVSKGKSKTKRSAPVPIIKPLLDIILNENLLMYPGHFYLFGENLRPGVNPCYKNLATNQFNEVCKKVGIYEARKTVLYGWKHTGNIAAYLAGMDIKTIQLINRHKSIQTTEIYLRNLGLFLDRAVFDFSY